MKDNPNKIVTFGCRLNTFESEVMRDHAENAGIEDSIIFNTCAVTSEATRQARQAIRRAHKENPDKRIIVTGCAAQIDPKMFAEIEGVDVVLGNEAKLKADGWEGLGSGEPTIKVNDIMTVKEQAGHMIKGLEGHTRAFIQVQNGCDHRCTFCIIPYGRGNSRSVPIGEVVRQVQQLVDTGHNEVVLTGVDITSYGPDLPGKPTLGSLIKSILKNVPDMPRVRISSIDSIEIVADPELMDAICHEPRLLPHMHLSLQSGDNMILKRMKRRHSREDAIHFATEVRKHRPGMVFGADIITGFPTETEEMFQQSLALVDDVGLSFLHVFPYSEREGTPAAKMPPVKKDIRKERAARLRAKGDEALNKLYQRLDGTTRTVLIERVSDEAQATGHTDEFAPVLVDGTGASHNMLKSGALLKVKITNDGDKVLKGTIVYE